ncbi:enoyl-CoA hydratase/isomerase family protein [Novosphingobium umbonatum]|uniref:Enoyl-CoA hydratase/isomerase family protein n=1 Tax=Novosphingobium umbonatum TaxID=1908524 RepID=A0A3S2X1F2_9SPHN|nr:enoyl-CoA hydratase/isomerase family protein [Novosphingobium umbonatum]RVU03224.1 enoyl-CoA hydratase/isomerase family protein [Novosphingobium umbonatum]
MSTLPSLETIGLELVDDIAILTLNRPRVRNAIDDQMRFDLKAAVDYVADERAIRGVVVTGAGAVFCSGGDIRGMQDRVDQGARAGELGWWRQKEFHETLGKIFHMGKPTVAAVNGPAFGLGLDVALTCDFVFLAQGAEVAANFVRRGLVSDGGGFFHIPRRVGVARAKELLFSGRTVQHDEALAIGLVDRVVAPDALISEAVAYLKGFATHPQTAQAMAKSILNRSLELGFDEINTLASQAQAYCYSSHDHQESVREFLAEREKARAAKGK